MHFTLQQNHIFYLLCIFITQTISLPIENVLLSKQNNISNEYSTILQSTTSITTKNYLLTSGGSFKRRSSDFNLKIVAIVGACFIFTFVVARLCIVTCNSSRSSNNELSNRRTSIVRPQIATIGPTYYNSDLPPAYAAAVAVVDNDESKLPSYDQLRNINS